MKSYAFLVNDLAWDQVQYGPIWRCLHADLWSALTLNSEAMQNREFPKPANLPSQHSGYSQRGMVATYIEVQFIFQDRYLSADTLTAVTDEAVCGH